MERMGSGSRHGGGLVIRYRRQKPMTITSAFGVFRSFGLGIPSFGLGFGGGGLFDEQHSNIGDGSIHNFNSSFGGMQGQSGIISDHLCKQCNEEGNSKIVTSKHWYDF